MDGNMVEENGNSSLDPLGEPSTHANSDEPSSHQQQQQQSQMNATSLQHQPSPSSAVLASSANIVQFIPAQSVQVFNFIFLQLERIKKKFHTSIIMNQSYSYYLFFFF